MTSLTSRLRVAGCAFWSLGLAVLAFGFLSMPVLEWRASLSYIFFAASAFCTAWAEKREFGTRVALYRLHDATIYSPWRFLLLYFLWISVFSPFTASPMASVVYAANGWLSLAAIGMTAQFVFSERTFRGIVLLPSRLAVAFWCYCFTVSLLLANALAHLFFPGTTFPMLANEQANLFFYFTMGLPFLLWDFLKDGRRLVPRWLSSVTVLMGCVTTVLLDQRFYLLAVLVSVGALLALFAFKRMRLRHVLLLAGFLSGWVIAAGLALLLWLEHNGMGGALDGERAALAERLRGHFAIAVDSLWITHGLGRGLGVTTLRGVWTRVLAEAGVVGFALYGAFFANVLRDLYRVRRSSRVVVSNVSFVSMAIFLVLVSQTVENPYSAYVWVWYALWVLFGSTAKKKGSA